MSSCPKCGSPIPESAFGLYNCESCTSVLSVDFNGNITLSEDVALTTPSEEGIEQEPTPVAPISEPEPHEAREVSSGGLELVSESPEAPRFLKDERPPFELEPPQRVSPSGNFEDVQAYANSEVSQGNEGGLLYDLLIKGIDSEDLRAIVREALTDTRFGWKTEDLIQKMRGGSIKLERLNAVKASVLVNKLKGSDVEIKWVQNGILDLVPKI